MQVLEKTGFKGFEVATAMRPEEIISVVKKSGLKGRGGANFSTGLKWEFTRKSEGKNKVLICNADEGEPGTFKDKLILKENPETLVEGIAIASLAMGIARSYIYLRAEYSYLKEGLDDAIKKYRKKLDSIGLKLDVFMGAGAYICGDETAIMNSIEGRRGEPRSKPPYPAKKGLFELPTCINNVETLANVPKIILGGWKPYRLFSLSGDFRRPGVYEAELGIRAGDLIENARPKRPIKALFFGCAGGCIPYDPDLILDVEHLKKKGVMLGSCTIIAVDESHSIPGVCESISEFFVHESCGSCTPCREGNYRVLEILRRLLSKNACVHDLNTLQGLAEMINETSFCGLGKSSNTHLLTAMKYFKNEFEDMVK